jgi:hypothetical protein
MIDCKKAQASSPTTEIKPVSGWQIGNSSGVIVIDWARTTKGGESSNR